MTCQENSHALIYIAGAGAILPNPDAQAIEFNELGARTVATCHPASISEDAEASNLSVWRRLSRGQKMAVQAAYHAIEEHPIASESKERVAVLIGTGFGETTETAAFLSNLVHKQEAEPKPQRFINSVHNSMAAAVAIAFGFQGENRTFLQGSASFECALGEGARLLQLGKADHALVGAADLISPYAILAREKHTTENLGEGCAFFHLTYEPIHSETSIRLLHTSSRLLSSSCPEWSTQAHEYLLDSMEKSGRNFAEIDAIIVDNSSIVAHIFGNQTHPPVYSYAKHTGWFPSRSAFGFYFAVKSIRTNQFYSLEHLEGTAPSRIKTILLLNGSAEGHLSISILTSL